jgi:hypothetical protein
MKATESHYLEVNVVLKKEIKGTETVTHEDEKALFITGWRKGTDDGEEEISISYGCQEVEVFCNKSKDQLDEIIKALQKVRKFVRKP